MSVGLHEVTPQPHVRKGIGTRILDRIIPRATPEESELTIVSSFEDFLRKAEGIRASRVNAILKRSDRSFDRDHVLTHTNEFSAIGGNKTIRFKEGYEEGTVRGNPDDVMEAAIAKRQLFTAELRLDEVLRTLPHATTAVFTPLLQENGVRYGGEFLPEERAELRDYAIKHKLEPLTPTV